MKKIYLVKTQQFDKVFYTGSVDARKLARLVDKSIDIDTLQEAQRPLEKSHLLEISKYIGNEKGMLPTSVIVGTKDKNKLVVEQEINNKGETLYYMMFPDTEKELKDFENTIDISDGQHRIFSFTDKYRNVNLKNSDNYNVVTTFFITPTKKEQQEIFLTVNAKQKTVAPNLLLWLRKQLGLLSDDEKEYLDLIELLNKENISPLKDKIIISAEKITKGYTMRALNKIFRSINFNKQVQTLSENIDNNKKVIIISTYLRGWERKYDFTFQKYDKTTKTKINGLNYMLLLLPTFLDIAVKNKINFNEEFVIKTIEDLETATNTNVINNETLFTREMAIPSLQSASGIVNLAKNDAQALLIYIRDNKSNQFDPFKSL